MTRGTYRKNSLRRYEPYQVLGFDLSRFFPPAAARPDIRLERRVLPGRGAAPHGTPVFLPYKFVCSKVTKNNLHIA